MNRSHHYIALALDILYREPKLIKKYYKPFSFFRNKRTDAKYIFMVDNKMPIGGMFDRLKGIISIFAISKNRNKTFKLNFKYPFDLSQYLMPNQYDWTIDDDEIVYQYPKSRPIIAYGEYADPKRLMKNHSGECHFYYGYNSLKEINAKFGSDYKWTDLYNELFRPTEHLQKYINYYKNEIGENYVVVHFRFLNLLGDKTETDINPVLDQKNIEALMIKSKNKIMGIAANHPNSRIMLSTDSNNFVEYIKKEIPEIYVVPGKIKHIGTAGTTSDEENLKMFIDYYLIAGAKCVYSVYGKGMWKSAFPEYSAMIGGCPFNRVSLD